MMSETKDLETIVMSPSDAIGAVQRGLQEVLGYLHNNNAMGISVPDVLSHIERLVPYLLQIQKMQQGALQAHAGNGNGAEQRAN